MRKVVFKVNPFLTQYALSYRRYTTFVGHPDDVYSG
jgi:hypothetical protein